MGCGASKDASAAVVMSNKPDANNSVSRSSVPATKVESAKTQTTATTEQEKANLMMVELNDIVTGSKEGKEEGRGRFLSYASGASTPNSSSSNLCLSGDTSDDGDPKRSPKARNPRILKHSLSGSLIELENLNVNSSLTSKVVHIEVPFGKPIEEVYDGVHSGAVLGSGVSGVVRRVTHKATGVEYAVKCLDLGLVGTKEGLEQLREEIFIMCQLDHPNIVRLEEVYESHSEIYLVQELCSGGELFDRLDEQPDYHYTEAACSQLVKQMLSAVRYLHSKGIIHRDLKLENFLFSSKAADSELKMIDFGLSKHFRFGEVHHEAVGTPYTVAPEVIRGSYDERCDIWAIGVITFLLFSGDPPFGGCGGPEPLMLVRSNILNGNFAFRPADIWGLVSDMGKDFIRSLLVTDPQKRPTAREAQKHPWLKQWASRVATETDAHVLNPNVVKALVGFKEFSDMRKLLSEVLSFTLLPEQIIDLRREFEKIDTDGSGEISLNALKKVLVTNAGAGSLGALTEAEVEDIFNAMRVNKANTRIHWHEFIAAGLSQCRVDDRNLRLAFDRLDADHKGYITLDDIANLIANDDLHTEEKMRVMWADSLKSVNCTQRHITYDHFLLLMKGQTKELESTDVAPGGRHPKNLESLPEEDSELSGIDSIRSSTNGYDVTTTRLEDLNADVGLDLDEDDFYPSERINSSLRSLPNMGAIPVAGPSNSDFPDESAGVESSSDDAVGGVDNLGKVSGAPAAIATTAVPHPPIITRGRSRSLETEALSPGQIAVKSSTEEGAACVWVGPDSRRALQLPEHGSVTNKDELATMSALAVNRQLYRAHRQMRLSVLEASRRFEENQASRARDRLMKEKVKEAMGAGLVMRHGTKLQVTTDAIRQYLDETQAEQQVLLDKANKRGGRRTNRKKTVSDMSDMLTPSMGQDELGVIAKTAAQTPDSVKQVLNASFTAFQQMPDLTSPAGAPSSASASPGAMSPKPSAFPGADVGGRPHHHRNKPGTVPNKDGGVMPPSLPKVDHVDVRKATVPGQFRKSVDPFGNQGMYGGSRLTNEDVNQIHSSQTHRMQPRHSTAS